MFVLLPQPLDQIPHWPSKKRSSPSHKAAQEKPLKTHLQTQPAKQRDKPETTDRTVAGPLPLPSGPLQTGRSSRRCSTCQAAWPAGLRGKGTSAPKGHGCLEIRSIINPHFSNRRSNTLHPPEMATSISPVPHALPWAALLSSQGELRPTSPPLESGLWDHFGQWQCCCVARKARLGHSRQLLPGPLGTPALGGAGRCIRPPRPRPLCWH